MTGRKELEMENRADEKYDAMLAKQYQKKKEVARRKFCYYAKTGNIHKAEAASKGFGCY